MLLHFQSYTDTVFFLKPLTPTLLLINPNQLVTNFLQTTSMASRLTLRHVFRHYSTFSTPPISKEKTREALRLIKSETNPERILEICRSASLAPVNHHHRAVLSFAVTKLSEANHFDGIRNFLDELFQTRPELNNERFISHAIVLYGHANMLPHAFRTFNHMREELHITPSANSLNALLHASIIAKDYKEVTRIYLEFPKIYSIQPNVDTYNLVIKSFAESGSTSSVFSILDEMDRNSIEPNAVTFNNAIAGFYNENKFDEVDKLVNLMEEKYKMPPCLSTYNVRIKSLCKLKRSSEAKALFQHMATVGIWPDSCVFKFYSETFKFLIHGFCKEGNVKEAKWLYDYMKKRMTEVNSGCYFTLVYSHCEVGEFEAALEIALSSISRGWYPSFSSMKKLVNGLVGVSKIDDAKRLIKKIKRKFPECSDEWDEVEAGFAEQ